MKKGLLAAAVLTVMIFTNSQSTHAVAENAEPELKLVKVTAYTGGTVTASGCKPYEGICATDLEHMGWVAVIYKAIPNGDGYDLGPEIYTLECRDTGGEQIRKGRVIDIYRDNLERCQEVMDKVYEDGACGHVYVQYIPADG